MIGESYSVATMNKQLVSKNLAVVVFAFLTALSASPLPAQTFDFYVADEEDGTGKFHSGTITLDPSFGDVEGNLYSWRHQRFITMSGNIYDGQVVASWQEYERGRVRVNGRLVWKWVTVTKSATVNLYSVGGGLGVAPEDRTVLIGSWREVGGGNQSGVFGGYDVSQ
jgi:hypothetical protein